MDEVLVTRWKQTCDVISGRVAKLAAGGFGTSGPAVDGAGWFARTFGGKPKLDGSERVVWEARYSSLLVRFYLYPVDRIPQGLPLGGSPGFTVAVTVGRSTTVNYYFTARGGEGYCFVGDDSRHFTEDDRWWASVDGCIAAAKL